MFERQIQHYLLLAVLLIIAGWQINPDVLVGEFLGIHTSTWLALALIVPIMHQIFVWFVWRSELYHAQISTWFGKEKGFTYFGIGFGIFLVCRFISIIAVAIANSGTLALAPGLAVMLSIILFIPWVYLIYSILKYFGFKRALGIDHFDPSYQNVSFVKKGIFRFTENGMYIFGFFIVWIVSLLSFSQAALLVAFFNHAYIWVHYYCTEQPDIHHIYGKHQQPA